MILRYLGIGCLLCATAAAQASHDPAEEHHNPVANSKPAIEAGAKRFKEGCAMCHGGSAEGGRGPALVNNSDLAQMNDDKLFGVIEHGIPGTSMPPSNLPENNAWEVAAYVRSLSSPASASPVDGDAQKGHDLFFGPGQCSHCHSVRGDGGKIGPDLSDAGSLTLLQLRDSILHPSNQIVTGFEHVSVTLKNGQSLDGVAKDNSDYSIQILDREGHLHNLNKTNVASIRLYRESLMPQDASSKLGASGLDDVLAFLAQQVGRPGEETQRKHGRHIQ